VQRSLDLAAPQRRIGVVRFFPRGIRRQLYDGVELGIDLGDLIQMGLHDRLRTELFGTDRVRKLARRFHGDVIIRAGRGFRLIDPSRAAGRRDHTRDRRRAQKIPSCPFVTHWRPVLTIIPNQLIPFRLVVRL
jgi:hypothetical protein